MQYRRLGNAGMKVSAVSLGGWINYGEDKMSSDNAESVIKAAYDAGVNFFDIADIYERGAAEKQMGAVLKQFPRSNLVISSKVFWPMSDNINDRSLSRKHILESIDKTLQRVGTDYLDIYFCHRADPETPLLETIRAMDDLIHQGKILYWATSEWPAETIAAACQICDQHGYYRPQSEQPEYSMIFRDRVEKEILPVTTQNGIGLVVWSPLAQGLLTGKYNDGIPADSRLAKEAWVKDRFLKDDIVTKVRGLQKVADGAGITQSELALAWVLRNDGVSSVITGATKPEQIIANVKAADIKLTPDMLQEIDHILGDEIPTRNR